MKSLQISQKPHHTNIGSDIEFELLPTHSMKHAITHTEEIELNVHEFTIPDKCRRRDQMQYQVVYLNN